MAIDPKRLKRLTDAAAEAEAELKRLTNRADETEKGIADLTQAEVEAAEAALALARATNQTEDVINELADKLDKLRPIAKAAANALNETEEAAERLAGAGENLGKELAGLIPIFGGNVDLADTFGGSLAALTVKHEGLGNALGKIKNDFLKNMNVQQMATNVTAANEEALAGYIAGTFSFAKALQEQSAGFARATGMGDKYDKAIMKTFRANQDAGVSAEESFEAYQTLIFATSKFAAMAPSQQAAVAGTVAVLNELGVSSDVSAQNLQIMTTSLNMNGMEAEETSRRLVTAAKAMGVAPQQMAADFASAGAQFASFGENAVDAFIDLREAAKLTGIELQGLLSITEQFTTFEGAANNVGKLNALLGGPFLNTIDMVTLSLEDPAAALQEVRNAVLDAGLSFDDMNPAMRRAVAAAAGLEDAGQLAALMSGELDGLGGASAASAEQLEELRKSTEFTQTLADELEATRLAFTANFGPIIKELIIPVLNKLQNLAEVLQPGGAVAVALLGFTSISVVTSMIIRAALRRAGEPIRNLTANMAALNTTLATTKPAAAGAGAGLKPLGPVAAATGKQMLALGGAIALIGVGVGLAAAGLSLLVSSFAKLEGDQLFYAAAGLAGFAVSVGLLVAALAFFANPIGAVAVGGLYAVGGAVALIGVGIGAAAAGMSLLISSIGELAKTADDLAVIGEIFEELSVPKMVTYTAAMTATAAVGMTPAGAVLAATAGVTGAVTGGGAAAAAPPAKVEVNIQGKMNKLFEIMDKRYVGKSTVTPGAKTPTGYLGS